MDHILPDLIPFAASKSKYFRASNRVERQNKSATYLNFGYVLECRFAGGDSSGNNHLAVRFYREMGN
ncbi:MAG: hypothetical protein AAFR62_15445 [Cyanobacteria bacterium J06629_2]